MRHFIACLDRLGTRFCSSSKESGGLLLDDIKIYGFREIRGIGVGKLDNLPFRKILPQTAYQFHQADITCQGGIGQTGGQQVVAYQY